MLRFLSYKRKVEENKVVFEVEFDEIPKDNKPLAVEVAGKCVYAMTNK